MLWDAGTGDVWVTGGMVEMHVLREQDYRYGAGVLILRADRVHWDSPDMYDGEPWYLVEGVQLSTLGAEVGYPLRVVVRGRALRIDRPVPFSA